jgi:hypothetical protein
MIACWFSSHHQDRADICACSLPRPRTRQNNRSALVAASGRRHVLHILHEIHQRRGDILVRLMLRA